MCNNMEGHKKAFRNKDYETDTALKGTMEIKTERIQVQHNMAKRPEFSVGTFLKCMKCRSVHEREARNRPL